MTIIGLVGNRGSGKTLTMAIYGILHYIEGYTIYSNFHFDKIKYFNINNLQDFKDIKTTNNIFLLDEIYMLADSRNSQSFANKFVSQMVMQSRKIGHGGKNIIMVSSPMFDTQDKRIRGLVDIVMEPTIVMRDENEKPLIILLEYFNTNSNKKKIRKQYLSTQLGTIDVPNMYNTYEDIETIEDGSVDFRKMLMKKYWGTDIIRASKLKSIMLTLDTDGLNMGMSKTDYGIVADFIMEMRKKYDEPPILN